MKKVLSCFFVCMFLSCNNSQDEKFISFLQTNFQSSEVENNCFVLVNSRGCLECEKHAFSYILSNLATLTNYQIIISSIFLKTIQFDGVIPKPIIIDRKNKLESTTLPINGVTILKFQNGRIKEIKSIDPGFLQAHSVKEFFYNI